MLRKSRCLVLHNKTKPRSSRAANAAKQTHFEFSRNLQLRTSHFLARLFHSTFLVCLPHLCNSQLCLCKLATFAQLCLLSRKLKQASKSHLFVFRQASSKLPFVLSSSSESQRCLHVPRAPQVSARATRTRREMFRLYARREISSNHSENCSPFETCDISTGKQRSFENLDLRIKKRACICIRANASSFSLSTKFLMRR